MSNGELPIVKPGVTGESPVPAEPKPEEKKQEAKPEPVRPDQFKDALKDQGYRARQMVQFPRRSPVADHGPDKAPQTQRRQVHVEPQNYRRLLQEPAFRPMRDSPLYHKMEQRSLAPRPGRPPKQGDALDRQHLSRLIQLRNRVADRGNMRQVVRFEIRQARARQQAERNSPFSRQSQTASAFFQRATHQAANQLLHRLAAGGGETPFEKMLGKVLQGNKVVPGQEGGKSTALAAKSGSAWKAFFTNVLKLGSRETPVTKSLNALVDALFRGTYQTLASQKGLTLVSDLRFMLGDKIVADKFARLMIENPSLLSKLAQLSPGDPIPADLLALLGTDINYLQLTHVAEGLTAEAREAARTAVLQQLRNPSNLEAQGRLERALLQGRDRPDIGEGRLKRRRGERGEDGSAWSPGGWPGGDPRFERERRPGRPRLWTFFLASVGVLLAFVAGYFIFRHVF